MTFEQVTFKRKLRLQHHFLKNQPEEQTSVKSVFDKKITGWTPPTGVNNNLDIYCGVLNEEIQNLQADYKHNQNLSLKQRRALRELKKLDEIVIKPADKGGAIVIWSKRDYITEARRQLSNRSHYKEVAQDPTLKFEKTITEYIKQATKEKMITQTTGSNITPKNSTTPTFYMLPKIHKVNIPGRPIVAAIGGPTEKISKYVDHHLRPLVKRTTSYIKDTRDVIQKLIKIQSIPIESTLCTIDVSALYTNIPHSEGKEACRRALNKRVKKEPPTEFLIHLMDFILRYNAFEFNNRYYIQIQGTAMGTCMAPSYANIFMADLEERFLKSQNKTPMVWWRFIDDIFMIWHHPADELEEFLTDLNKFHQTIKFTTERSTERIPFLDLYINKVQTHLHTSSYHKPTDRPTYLHYRSNHPKIQKDSIPYAQMLRMVRNNTKEDDKIHFVKQMGLKFLERGYPRKLIQTAQEKALKFKQEDLLQETRIEKTKKPIYVSTYNPRVGNLKQTILKHDRILKLHPDTAGLFENGLVLAYRKVLNLRQILTKSQLSKKKVKSGSYPCGKCRICRYMSKKTTITDNKGTTYQLRNRMDCNSTSIVYMIECTKCHLKYIGQTSNALKYRITQHISDINRKDRLKPVGLHFSNPTHSLKDFDVTGIMTSQDDVIIRLNWERAWIRLLDTLQPAGLNRKE